MKILAVDLDETCLDVVPVWKDWCKLFFGFEYKGNAYDLSTIYGEEAMTFWSTPFLYQKLKLKEGCVETLTKLHEEGWYIGFVSYAKKAHFSSKAKMIKQHFPFYSFIHPTKEKGFTRCDWFVDDRNKYLNQQPEGVNLIKMVTPYTQDEGLITTNPLHEVKSWDEIYCLLKDK